MTPTVLQYAAAGAAAFTAGAMNSVAGGGTLLTFPTLIWLGLNSVTANATSTVAIWPASLGGMVGYRRELRGVDPKLLWLALPSVVGGIVGAWLLRFTPPSLFDKLVPWLILFATVLFMAQAPIQKRLKASLAGNAGGDHHSAKWLAGAMVFQLFVALYGGYFGAGIGILMLAALSILGVSDIHVMNGLKNTFGMCINGVAAVYFIVSGMVSWPFVLVMCTGAILGGVSGAGMARKLGRDAVRRIVVAIGFAMALSLFLKR